MWRWSGEGFPWTGHAFASDTSLAAWSMRCGIWRPSQRQMLQCLSKNYCQVRTTGDKEFCSEPSWSLHSRSCLPKNRRACVSGASSWLGGSISHHFWPCGALTWTFGWHVCCRWKKREDQLLTFRSSSVWQILGQHELCKGGWMHSELCLYMRRKDRLLELSWNLESCESANVEAVQHSLNLEERICQICSGLVIFGRAGIPWELRWLKLEHLKHLDAVEVSSALLQLHHSNAPKKSKKVMCRVNLFWKNWHRHMKKNFGRLWLWHFHRAWRREILTLCSVSYGIWQFVWSLVARRIFCSPANRCWWCKMCCLQQLAGAMIDYQEIRLQDTGLQNCLGLSEIWPEAVMPLSFSFFDQSLLKTLESVLNRPYLRISWSVDTERKSMNASTRLTIVRSACAGCSVWRVGLHGGAGGFGRSRPRTQWSNSRFVQKTLFSRKS